jgi:hypothetical protein
MTSLLYRKDSCNLTGHSVLNARTFPSGMDPDNTSGMINWHRQASARLEPKEGATVPGTYPEYFHNPSYEIISAFLEH